MKFNITIFAFSFAVSPLSGAVDYGKLADSVDKEKASQSVDQDKLKEYNQVLNPEYKQKLAAWEKQRDTFVENWGYKDADLMAMAGIPEKEFLNPNPLKSNS